jgi:hypothetical protein
MVSAFGGNKAETKTLTFMGEDVREGAAALIEKRPPVFG